MANSITFYFNNIMNAQFTQSNTNASSPVNFQGIGASGDWWDVMQGPFLDTLYTTNDLGNDFVYYENKLLGVPRLRQVRVKRNSCKVPALFAKTIPDCYDSYSFFNEDTSSYSISSENQTSVGLVDSA